MTAPLRPETPAQVGSVVGVDRMDTIDRAKQDPRVKLELLAIEMKNTTGRDPRGGGFALVCRPRIALQILLDLQKAKALDALRHQDAVVIGEYQADVIGWWCNVPLIVRSNVKDDQVYCLMHEHIPPSTREDRQRAGQLRMAAKYDKLESLRD